MASKVTVYITIDTECAEERGAAPALGWDLRVWGRFDNQRRALGIELIMDELERFGLRGTFFTEALGAQYFGQAGLERVCRAMVARGHDIQLHVHPRQIVANWRTLGVAPAADDIASYDVAEQARLLESGIATLEACGVPRGSVLAFRAGNFGASNATWQAMAQAGLVLSSNYNPCYFDKNCKMRFANASAGLFAAEHGIWELPITNLVEHNGGHRHAQITAISRRELRGLLESAHRTGLGEVTIVTHSFELFHLDSATRRLGRPNSVNVLRLRSLARFLAEHRDRFAVETVGALAQRLRHQPAAVGSGPLPLPHPSGDRVHRALRFAGQAYKRLEQRLPWSLPVA